MNVTFRVFLLVSVVVITAQQAPAQEWRGIKANEVNARRCGPCVRRMLVAGQETRKIVLDTTGLAGKVFTVTIEVADGSHHTAYGSCSITVLAPPKN